MNKTLTALIVALSLLPINAYCADVFTDNGLTYEVSDETAKTCTLTGTADGMPANVVIPETVNGYTVTEIAKEAFLNAETMRSVVMPNTVTALGENVFYRCWQLESATLSTGLTVVPGSTFQDCTNLSSIVVPEGVVELKGYVFYGCTRLTSIVLPSTLTAIGNNCLYGVGSAGDATILCRAAVPPICTASSFGYRNCYVKAIQVPAASVEDYKTALGWSAYAEKITAIPEFTVFVKADQTPSVYIWDKKEISKPWPGNEMTETTQVNGHTFYYYTIKGYDSVNLVVVIGKDQTGDIKGVSSDIYFNGTTEINIDAVLSVALDHGVVEFPDAAFTETPIKVKASDGWMINNVTLGDEQITLDDEGAFKVPVLSESKTLTVVYVEDTSTGIGTDSYFPKAKVYVSGGHVRIEGAAPNALVSVYDINGKLVKQTAEHSFSLCHKGVILLNVDGNTYKFTL